LYSQNETVIAADG
jgi:hypothetical protein